MRNDDSPTIPGAWAGAIVKLDLHERARLLGRLLAFVGPLAMAVLGDGVFAKYLRFARKAFVPVTPEDAALATVTQVNDLVRYVQQSHPGSLPAALRCDDARAAMRVTGPGACFT